MTSQSAVKLCLKTGNTTKQA